jgi:hypothetical protein
MRSRILWSLSFALLAGASALFGCGPDPMIALEAERAELLESTVEKGRFWAEVERKGAAEQALRALETDRTRQMRELAQLDGRLTQLVDAVARAEEINATAQELLESTDAQRAELEAEVARLEQTLVRWGAPLPESAPAEGNES